MLISLCMPVLVSLEGWGQVYLFQPGQCFLIYTFFFVCLLLCLFSAYFRNMYTNTSHGCVLTDPTSCVYGGGRGGGGEEVQH